MAKVVVVGLGKSGMAASMLLAGRGDTVFITEERHDGEIEGYVEGLVKDGILKRDNIEVGCHTDTFIKGSSLVVVSPGVRLDSLPVKIAEEAGIPIISEIELAYSMCPAPIIAITGTCGKTTVSTLIYRMLKRAGKDAYLCGNIGNPFSAQIGRLREDSIVVLEVSSFQLEWVKRFRPRISVILNISANHLDRHRDFHEYLMLKARIFMNQNGDDLVFLNERDRHLRGLIGEAKARVEYFDRFKDFRMRHNIKNENFLASMSVSSCIGVREDDALEIIKDFKGIEHRLEHVTSINGIDFINDSKATTVASVEWALRSLDRKLILIMGGRYKGGDFTSLKDLVKEKVSFIVSLGEAGERIREDLACATVVFRVSSLEEAVKFGFSKARERETVLLSPGCSSFDMFKNYEERGRIFKELVNKLRQ